MVKTEAAEAEISLRLAQRIGKTPNNTASDNSHNATTQHL